MATNKGFIKDFEGNHILPITRGELVLDKNGVIAFNSEDFLAKDNHPGLVTAAERAMLMGGGTNGGIQDIYTKLGYINSGLKVGEVVLSFYNNDGATPIQIVADNTINVSSSENKISFGLNNLTEDSHTVANIIKSLTVDKYGRVTSVSGEALNNDDIPSTLSGKTLTGCTAEVTDQATNSTIVNKKYVDDLVKAASDKLTGIASGALVFGGVLEDAEAAKGTLNPADSSVDYNNHYFKVTKQFTLPAEYLHFETSQKTIKLGDTLIVHTDSQSNKKFVHIPSGDDYTAITIEQNNAEILTGAQRDITFDFGKQFTVTKQANSQYISIEIPTASTTASGILSKEDYQKFLTYSSKDLTIDYNSSISGTYDIGTLTIGGQSFTLQGINTTYNLAVENSTSDSIFNPYLKFTETNGTLSSNEVKIQVKGSGLAQVTNTEGKSLNVFVPAMEVVEQDGNDIKETGGTSYLTVTDGYKLGVKIGSITGNTINDGLTTYRQHLAAFSQTLTFLKIENSLKRPEGLSNEDFNKAYMYGSTALKQAVDVEI